MSVSVSTTAGNTVSVSVDGGTAVSFTESNSTVSVTSPTTSSISVTNKGPKGDTGATGATGSAGPTGSTGAAGTTFTAGTGLTLSGGDLTVDTLNQNTTGSAATATALATTRAINGVNFDGTAPITVTAAAGTLSGSTLKATVTASSLTSVGTLSALTMEGAVDMQGEDLNCNSGEIIGVASITALQYNGAADADLMIQSDGNLTFKIDRDDDETGQSFSFVNHASTEIANLDESGNLQLDGVLTAKTYHTYHNNIYDSIGTTKIYLPTNSQSTSEQTTANSSNISMVSPANGRLVTVVVRVPQSYNPAADATITIGVEKQEVGDSSAVSFTSIETEAVTIAADQDYNVVHYTFDNATWSVGELIAIYIQSDVDPAANMNWFITSVIEYDWSTRYTGSSAIHT